MTRTRTLIVLTAFALAGCAGGRLAEDSGGAAPQAQAPYLVRASFNTGSAEGERLSVRWVEAEVVETPRASFVAVLEEGFENAEAARAFTDEVVVTLDGEEVGRFPVSFGDCDVVTDLGVDPARVRGLVLDGPGLAVLDDPGGSAVETEWRSVGCWMATPVGEANEDPDVLRHRAFLRFDGPDVPTVEVTSDRGDASVGFVEYLSGDDGHVTRVALDVDLPGHLSPAEADASLTVLLDGEAHGPVSLSFDGCTDGPPGGEAGELTQKEVYLTFVPPRSRDGSAAEGAEGPLTVDGWDGYTCTLADGRWWFVTP